MLASDYDGESVVIKAWADDIGAPISEEDAARVIGTSLHVGGARESTYEVGTSCLPVAYAACALLLERAIEEAVQLCLHLRFSIALSSC